MLEAVVLAVALATVGCSPATGPDASTPTGPDATGAAPVFDGVVGVDWLSYPLPDELADASFQSLAVGAGGIWMLARTDELVLASLRDGVTWEVTPLTELGAPSGLPGSGHIIVSGDEVAIVLDNADSGQRTNVFPEAGEVQPTPRILRFDGENWSSWGAEDAGTWEEADPAYSLHYVGVAGAAFRGSDVVAAAMVRWFGGGARSLVDESIGIAVHSADGSSRLSTPDSPPQGNDVESANAVVADGERVHVLGDTFLRASDQSKAVVWSTDDGLEWQQSFLDPDAVSGAKATNGVVFGNRLVVAVEHNLWEPVRTIGELWVRESTGEWSQATVPVDDALMMLLTDGDQLFAISGPRGEVPSLWATSDLGAWNQLGPAGVRDSEHWAQKMQTMHKLAVGYHGGIAFLSGFSTPSIQLSGVSPFAQR